MNKTFLLIAIAFAFLAGCLQEKQLDQGATIQPTTQITPTATAQATATPTATPSGTATVTATPTASPTVEPGGTCIVNTPQNRDTFSKASVVEYFVVFSQLPQSIATAQVKCDTSDSAQTLEITRSSSGTYVRKSCIYSPSSTRTYTLSVTAGGAACTRTVTVTA